MSFNICVFCGSSSPKSDQIKNEVELLLDNLLADKRLNLVYGGANIGIMGVVAERFLQSGREVVGVMPSFLKAREVDHPHLTEFIETETMHQRKQLMYDKADVFLVLPGGYGTLDELFEAACWSQLDQHKKPIYVYDAGNFFSQLNGLISSMYEGGFISAADKEIIQIFKDPLALSKAILSTK